MYRTTVAMYLAAIGIIFFFAMPFKVLENNVATFFGIAFLILSAVTWGFWPAPKKQ